jgi:hypothetical protein
MTVSSPKEEEFEWRGKKLVHKPSGANWTVTDDAVAYEASKLGGKGEAEHGVDEVIEMGRGRQSDRLPFESLLMGARTQVVRGKRAELKAMAGIVGRLSQGVSQ